jgi:hypothetical protein
MAPPILSSTAASRETTATMTTMMATTIAPLATIESTGAAVVLLPHGAKPPVVVVAYRSSAIRKRERAEAGAFDRHRRAAVHAFVLGRGWRNNGVVGRRRRTMGCWRFGGGGERWDVGDLGAWARTQVL